MTELIIDVIGELSGDTDLRVQRFALTNSVAFFLEMSDNSASAVRRLIDAGRLTKVGEFTITDFARVDAGEYDALYSTDHKEVILSYPPEAAEIAALLRDDLVRRGINVRLVSEADLAADRKGLERHIENGALYVPISTPTLTTTDDRHFFWREWRLALDVVKRSPPNRTYILPIAIDIEKGVTDELAHKIKRLVEEQRA